jgi:release factor glutamine methyltransferase
VIPADVVRRGADYLARHDVDSPTATAEVLLARVLGTDRAGIYARSEPLRSHEAKAFGRALCRRCAREPLQHIMGETGFRRLTLVVRPRVFVPRPETEVVVDAALDVVRAASEPEVVDVGTGTGAIALAIKDERPDARVLAIDRAPEAVRLARENAARCRLDVDVRLGDLLADPATDDPRRAGNGGRGAEGPFDLVVSNPPYVSADDYERLPPEVRADPIEALVGGLDIYERIFAESAPRLRPGGAVVVEIDERQAAAVSDAARAAGASSVRVRTDLAGRDRVVVARWP